MVQPPNKPSNIDNRFPSVPQDKRDNYGGFTGRIFASLKNIWLGNRIYLIYKNIINRLFNRKVASPTRKNQNKFVSSGDMPASSIPADNLNVGLVNNRITSSVDYFKLEPPNSNRKNQNTAQKSTSHDPTINSQPVDYDPEGVTDELSELNKILENWINKTSEVYKHSSENESSKQAKIAASEKILACFRTQSHSLDLSSGNLTDLPAVFHLLPQHLECLNLSDNQLTFLPPEIQHLKSLAELSLSFNQLVAVPEIEQLVNLYTLDLSSNELLILFDIRQLKHLTYLNLNCNQLVAIPPEDHTQKLEHFLIDDNFLAQKDLRSKKGGFGRSINTNDASVYQSFREKIETDYLDSSYSLEKDDNKNSILKQMNLLRIHLKQWLYLYYMNFESSEGPDKPEAHANFVHKYIDLVSKIETLKHEEIDLLINWLETIKKINKKPDSSTIEIVHRVLENILAMGSGSNALERIKENFDPHAENNDLRNLLQYFIISRVKRAPNKARRQGLN